MLPELCDTLRRVATGILGETNPVNTLAVVPNATYAVNSVARSVIVSSGRVEKGDVVLCFGKSYGACVSSLDLACRDVGAKLARFSPRNFLDGDDDSCAEISRQRWILRAESVNLPSLISSRAFRLGASPWSGCVQSVAHATS